MEKNRVLVVDDDEVTLKNLSRLLSNEGYDVSCARSGATALDCLAKSEYDLVLSDLVMDDVTGLEVLERSKSGNPDTEVILVTGHASIPTAIEAIRSGAYYYLEKPFRPEEVRRLARLALEKKRLTEQVRELEARVDGSGGPVLVGRSREIQAVIKLIEQVATADCNVLLTGESGTGKELAAALLHHRSRRSDRKFLAVNCGGFAEDLLANELFGHDKDAFTGATSAKPGLLESASGGTLMLDEVGDMPPAMQVKLLRVIEEQEVIRVGGTRPIPIDVRIVAATNQDLKKAVSAGLFRHDLYYRLNVVSINIPPLRERRDDVPILAHYFLNRSRRRSGKDVTGFSEDATGLLMSYDYPGNVRELENIVERAMAMSERDLIQASDLPPDLSEMEIFSFARSDSTIKPLKQVERDYIQWVLNKTGRNKTKAAQLLGIDRASLWRHLKRYELKD